MADDELGQHIVHGAMPCHELHVLRIGADVINRDRQPRSGISAPLIDTGNGLQS